MKQSISTQSVIKHQHLYPPNSFHVTRIWTPLCAEAGYQIQCSRRNCMQSIVPVCVGERCYSWTSVQRVSKFDNQSTMLFLHKKLNVKLWVWWNTNWTKIFWWTWSHFHSSSHILITILYFMTFQALLTFSMVFNSLNRVVKSAGDNVRKFSLTDEIYG